MRVGGCEAALRSGFLTPKLHDEHLHFEEKVQNLTPLYFSTDLKGRCVISL